MTRVCPEVKSDSVPAAPSVFPGVLQLPRVRGPARHHTPGRPPAPRSALASKGIDHRGRWLDRSPGRARPQQPPPAAAKTIPPSTPVHRSSCPTLPQDRHQPQPTATTSGVRMASGWRWVPVGRGLWGLPPQFSRVIAKPKVQPIGPFDQDKLPDPHLAVQSPAPGPTAQVAAAARPGIESDRQLRAYWSAVTSDQEVRHASAKSSKCPVHFP